MHSKYEVSKFSQERNSNSTAVATIINVSSTLQSK